MGTRAAVLILAIGLFGAKPVLQRTDDGVINWTDQIVQVVGVGTPRIMSPTGGLQDKDLYEAAKGDARARLERLLGLIRIDARRRARDLAETGAPSQKALETFTAQQPRRFTDGTTHLPAQVGFDWMAGAIGGGRPAVDPERQRPGLVIVVRGPLEPTLQLELAGEGTARRTIGLPTDTLGQDGVRWFTRPADAQAFAGKSARTVRVTVGKGAAPGRLPLGAKDADLLTAQDGPTRIAVVVRR